MMVMDITVFISLLAFVISFAEAEVVRRDRSLSSFKVHKDVNAKQFATSDAGRESHMINDVAPLADLKRIGVDPEIGIEIGETSISDAKTALTESPRILRSVSARKELGKHVASIRTDEIMAWIPDEGLTEAIIEMVLAYVAFMFISVSHKRLRGRKRQSGNGDMTSQAKQGEKIVAVVSTGAVTAHKAPVAPAHQMTGSAAATHGRASTNKSPSPNDFGRAEANALVSAIKGGRAAELPRLLATMQARAEARGDEFSEKEDRILATVLRTCAAQHCFKEALAAYDFWADAIADVGETKGIWSLLLYAAASSGNFVRCQGFYNKVCEEGPPSCHDFVNLVRALAHQQDMDGLCAAIDGIRHLNSCELDSFTRNRALAACASENALELAATLLAAEIFTEKPDAVAYNTLMKGFSRQGRLERCFQLFNEMHAKGLVPSEMSFGILLDACVRAEDFDKAQAVCQDLRQSGLRLNAVLCTTCIKGLVGAGRLDEAATMLEEMQRSPDAKPDLITYSTLVKAYTDRGCIGDALEIVRAMIARRVKPDEIILNSVLSACIQAAVSSKEAFRVFDTLRKLGLCPSTSSLSIFLKTLTLNGDYELALNFLAEVPVRCCGMQVEARLFAQIVQAAAQANQGDQAVVVFEAMCDTLQQRGETLDCAIYARLVRFCQHCGQHTAAERLREAVRQVGLSRQLRDVGSAPKFACKSNGKHK